MWHTVLYPTVKHPQLHRKWLCKPPKSGRRDWSGIIGFPWPSASLVAYATCDPFPPRCSSSMVDRRLYQAHRCHQHGSYHPPHGTINHSKITRNAGIEGCTTSILIFLWGLPHDFMISPEHPRSSKAGWVSQPVEICVFYLLGRRLHSWSSLNFKIYHLVI